MKNKMGNFRGYPVYLVDDNFFDNADTLHDNALYVVNGRVFFHDVYLGKVDRYNNLVDFNEDRFNALCQKSWNEDSARAMARVTNTAETRPQEEEKPELSDAERAAAQEDVAGQFMLEWQSNIDNEIAKLQLAVAEMEGSLDAVG